MWITRVETSRADSAKSRRPFRQLVTMVLMAVLVAGPAIVLALLYVGGGSEDVDQLFRLVLLVLVSAPLVIEPHPGHLTAVAWQGWLAIALLLVAVPATLVMSVDISMSPDALASTRADDEEVRVVRWNAVAVVGGLAIGAVVTFGFAVLGRLLRQRGMLRLPAVGLLLLIPMAVVAISAWLRVAFTSEAGFSEGATIALELAALWWPSAPAVALLAGAEWLASDEVFPSHPDVRTGE